MPLVAHSSLSSTELKWGLLFIDLGGQGKRLSSWWEVELSAPIPLAGDPEKDCRAGWAFPGPSLQASSMRHPSPPPPAPTNTPSQALPLPWGALGQLLLAWTALIFPLLIIRSCLWRRQTGAPGGRPAQAQVRGSAGPGVWLVGAGHKGFLYKARAFALSF